MGDYTIGLIQGVVLSIVSGTFIWVNIILIRECIKAHKEDHVTQVDNNV